VVIIVVVILIYKFVIQNNGSGKKKRWVLPTADMPALNSAPVVSGQPWTPSEKLVVPGLEWTDENTLSSKPVVPDTEWTPPTTSGKWIKFAA
jgi:syntaxin 1B/2/3